MKIFVKSQGYINRTIIQSLLIGILVLIPFSSYCLEVNVEGGEGVSQDVIKDLENGIRLVEDFYNEVYGLDLKYPIRVYLVNGKERYLEALGTEGGMSRERVEKEGYNSSGCTTGHLIIADIEYRDCDEVLYIVAHELTHQYQMSLCRSKELMWLSEGTADVIAESILSKNGRGSINNMARDHMKDLQAVPRVPELSKLYSNQSWMNSANTTGQGINYYTADMAVICLIGKVGYEPLFTYFKLLGKKSAEQAFSEAFGMSIKDFESEFRDYLVENGVTI